MVKSGNRLPARAGHKDQLVQAVMGKHVSSPVYPVEAQNLPIPRTGDSTVTRVILEDTGIPVLIDSPIPRIYCYREVLDIDSVDDRIVKEPGLDPSQSSALYTDPTGSRIQPSLSPSQTYPSSSKGEGLEVPEFADRSLCSVSKTFEVTPLDVLLPVFCVGFLEGLKLYPPVTGTA